MPPVDAVRLGATLSIAKAAAKPRPMPRAPPIRPVTIASPITWRTTRREVQPSALRVPNSRTRRPTADMVNSAATANAAISTAIESHRPRLLAREAAEEIEPVTDLARSAEVVTVAVESAFLIAARRVLPAHLVGGADAELLHPPVHAGRSGQRAARPHPRQGVRGDASADAQLLRVQAEPEPRDAVP